MSRTLALLLAGGLAAAGLAGCLPDTRNRVARFLFDGVPPLQAQPEAAEEAAQPVADPPEAARPGAEARPAALPAYYVHPPYAARDCALCHDARSPGRLQKQVPELCLDCHARAELAAVHGEIGDCLACHDPHKARAAFLLDFE